jgi:hypothetical protein
MFCYTPAASSFTIRFSAPAAFASWRRGAAFAVRVRLRPVVGLLVTEVLSVMS